MQRPSVSASVAATLSFNEHGTDIKKAVDTVLGAAPASTKQPWVLCTVVSDGVVKLEEFSDDGGINELSKNLEASQEQFALARICPPKSGSASIVLFCWCGDGVPTFRKALFNTHVNDAKRFFRFFHVEVVARNEDDVSPDFIYKKLRSAPKAHVPSNSSLLSNFSSTSQRPSLSVSSSAASISSVSSAESPLQSFSKIDSSARGPGSSSNVATKPAPKKGAKPYSPASLLSASPRTSSNNSDASKKSANQYVSSAPSNENTEKEEEKPVMSLKARIAALASASSSTLSSLSASGSGGRTTNDSTANEISRRVSGASLCSVNNSNSSLAHVESRLGGADATVSSSPSVPQPNEPVSTTVESVEARKRSLFLSRNSSIDPKNFADSVQSRGGSNDERESPNSSAGWISGAAGSQNTATEGLAQRRESNSIRDRINSLKTLADSSGSKSSPASPTSSQEQRFERQSSPEETPAGGTLTLSISQRKAALRMSVSSSASPSSVASAETKAAESKKKPVNGVSPSTVAHSHSPLKPSLPGNDKSDNIPQEKSKSKASLQDSEVLPQKATEPVEQGSVERPVSTSSSFGNGKNHWAAGETQDSKSDTSSVKSKESLPRRAAPPPPLQTQDEVVVGAEAAAAEAAKTKVVEAQSEMPDAVTKNDTAAIHQENEERKKTSVAVVAVAAGASGPKRAAPVPAGRKSPASVAKEAEVTNPWETPSDSSESKCSGPARTAPVFNPSPSATIASVEKNPSIQSPKRQLPVIPTLAEDHRVSSTPVAVILTQQIVAPEILVENPWSADCSADENKVNPAQTEEESKLPSLPVRSPDRLNRKPTLKRFQPQSESSAVQPNAEVQASDVSNDAAGQAVHDSNTESSLPQAQSSRTTVYRVLTDYDSTDHSNGIQLLANHMVTVTTVVDDYWWEVSEVQSGITGIFPASYLEACPEENAIAAAVDSEPSRKCVVIYDFIATAEGELTAKEGELIFDVKNLDENWIEGTSSTTNQRGIIPITYVKIE